MVSHRKNVDPTRKVVFVNGLGQAVVIGDVFAVNDHDMGLRTLLYQSEIAVKCVPTAFHIDVSDK
jgi:hypothetical protein